MPLQLPFLSDTVGESDSLWLDKEPTLSDIVEGLRSLNMADYRQLVFCGYGEPTERLDILLQVADHVKANYSLPVRLNTNGLGNLINGRDIAPLLAGRIDVVSISLNAPDAETYLDIVRPVYGAAAFDAMLSFARDCVQYVPEVVLSTVSTTITAAQEAACAEICRSIGAKYRIRPFES